MSIRRVAVAVIAAAAGSGCGGAGDELTVFAAASLTDVIDDVAERYEQRHPGTSVVVTTAGSSTLVAQLVDGAPADVVITADLVTMQRAADADVLAGEPVIVASNELVIATEPGNPLGIGGIDDLTADDIVVVLAAADVPAGAYAQDVLSCAGADVSPASLEQNVRSAAAKVALGEADAAIVYRTDVGPGLDLVEIDPACRVRAEYAIAVVTDAPEAQRFVDEMVGAEGLAALLEYGFGPP